MRLRLVLASILFPSVALAQADAGRDQATRACLLLRDNPADCLPTSKEAFFAPGDILSLQTARPPMSRRARARSKPSYLSGTLAADVVVEANRQLLSIPASWTPSNYLDLQLMLPLVHLALPGADNYGLGDIAFAASTNVPVGAFDLRGFGSVKLPSGNQKRGTGSGEVDALGFADAWFYAGDFALTASGAYRFNGKRDDLVQESVGAAYWLELLPLELGLSARLFAHQTIGQNARRTLHGVFSVEPSIFGVSAYVGLFVPLASGQDLPSNFLLTAGISAPFGRTQQAPAAPTAQIAPIAPIKYTPPIVVVPEVHTTTTSTISDLK